MKNEIKKSGLKLTPQQESFATAYTTIGSPTYSNAHAAALEAGYSEGGARTQGWKLIHHPAVRQRIAEIHRENMSRNYLTVDKVLSDLEHLRRKAEEKGDLSSSLRAVELTGKFLGAFSDRHIFAAEEQPRQETDPEVREVIHKALNDYYSRKYLAVESDFPPDEAVSPQTAGG